jgi:hypothetical protein
MFVDCLNQNPRLIHFKVDWANKLPQECSTLIKLNRNKFQQECRMSLAKKVLSVLDSSSLIDSNILHDNLNSKMNFAVFIADACVGF